MNVMHQAKTAYGSTQKTTRTPRGIEYEAFARITHSIKSADKKGNFNELVSALHNNRRLWTILASDVAEDTNGLPNELRARIFYLAEFINLQSRQVLKGEAPVGVLVDVNSAVMKGLRMGGTTK